MSPSPNTNLGDVSEDFALEEGLPQDGIGKSSAGGVNPNKSRLSVVSSKYDVDGNGVLDEAEQAMRDMDTSNRGFLTNDKVYRIVQEQMAMQQQMFNMKRILIGLSVFTVILALSNLGTAWAAAVLARDSQVNSASGNMYTKDGEHMVGTQAKAAVFDVAPDEEDDRRELNLFQKDSRGKVPIGIKTELEGCATDTIRIRYVCDSAIKFYDYQCGHPHAETPRVLHNGKEEYYDGTITIESCSGQTCNVNGLPCGNTGGFTKLTLANGELCYSNEECESENCEGGDGDGVYGYCQPLSSGGMPVPTTQSAMPVPSTVTQATDPPATCGPCAGCPSTRPIMGTDTCSNEGLSCQECCEGDGSGDPYCEYSCGYHNGDGTLVWGDHLCQGGDGGEAPPPTEPATVSTTSSTYPSGTDVTCNAGCPNAEPAVGSSCSTQSLRCSDFCWGGAGDCFMDCDTASGWMMGCF